MEKRAVIEPGRTPDEKPGKLKTEKKASDQIAELDSDFRKRAADVANKTARL